tara:strand:- start:34 stop:435 length:402 start_codon:yes stop_codon:yes gene_type:complete
MKQNIVYFKLVSGDDIISYVDEELNTDEEQVMLYKPLKLFTYNTERGSAVRLAKWIPFVDGEYFLLNEKKIILSSPPSQDILEFYHEAIDTLDEYEMDQQYESAFESLETSEEEEALTQALYERFSNTSIMVH